MGEASPGGLAMSAERKKLLWISISACVFVLLVLATGFFLLAPKKGSAQAPATIGNSAPPKAQDPQDYLSAPPASPSLEQPKSQDGNVIVVYGDKPPLPSSGAPGTAGATGASGASAAAGQAEQPAAQSTTASAQGTPPTAKEAAGKAPQSEGAAKAAPTAPAKKAPSAKSSAESSPIAKSRGAIKPAKADAFWIQAGSFASRGRADELKQSLAEKGLSALITVKDASGKSLYRVRIGPYSSEPEAKDWLGKVKGLDGCSAAYILNASAKKAK